MKIVTAFLVLVSAVSSIPEARGAATTLIVHEWGTFTSFQDSNGATIPGINVDDEPAPKFVHRLNDFPVFTTRSIPARWSQGAPRCHPDVTLRLETPVLYFHPQPGFPEGQSLDVRAAFVGGWLTEFFPYAEPGKTAFPVALDRSTRGSLQWSGLTLTTDTKNVPQTNQRVWLAPRAVSAAVITDGREAEKYLFYRGVGHLDAPLVVRARDRGVSISLRNSELPGLPPMWLVRVLPDGRVRYSRVPASAERSVEVSLPAAEAAAASQLAALRAEVAAALLAEGLYADEVQAMLDTWRLSYFESEGTRLFFVLPRAWTDQRLPLTISVPADITRVMLGRVELVSPFQRAALRRLRELPDAAFDIKPLYVEDPKILSQVERDLRGAQALSASHAGLYRSIGREVPEALQLYESLGRFRDALLLHQWNATSDGAARARLMRVIDLFGACSPESAAR